MSTKLWRLLGALVIGSVVLSWAAIAVEGTTPGLGSSPATVVKHLMHGGMPARFAGGYLEALSSIVVLFAGLLLARLLRGTTELSGWLAAGIGATIVLNVGSALIVGFPAGAAAIYDGHHGASVQTVTMVNDLRNFAHFLSITLLGVFTACVAGAILATRALSRWLAWSGFAVGLLCVVSVAGARSGVHDVAGLVQTVWWVALGIVALRYRPALSVTARRTRDTVSA